MSKRILLLSSMLVLALGCIRPPRQAGCTAREFTDDLGRKVTVSARVDRVISFAPSLTEMIFAIGAGDRLAGVTSWCNWPPQVRGITVIGDMASPNFERMVSLKPDLVVMVGNKPGPVLEKLEALGLPVLVFRDEAFDDINRAITVLGGLMDHQRQADSVNSVLSRRLDSIKTLVNGTDPGLRPRVFAEIGSNPLFSGGDKSFIGQMIVAAGGINITADLEDYYAAVNPEKVAGRDPDIILILHPGTTASQASRRMGWREIKAVRNNMIYDRLDQDVVLRPGPRFVEGLKLLHQSFYPAKQLKPPGNKK